MAVGIAENVKHAAELEAQRAITRETQQALLAAQRKLASRERNLEYLVDAVIGAARDAQLAQPPLPKPPKLKVAGKGTSLHAAILHTTDWQCGKVTEDFNSDVLGERLASMMDITEILVRRHGNPCDLGVVLLGGDMVEGINIFATQAFEINQSLYEQLFTVVRYIQSCIDRALNMFPRVKVVAKWGNHGRIGRFGELPDPDNIDRMAYRIAWERYANEPRVTWDVHNMDYVQQFQVGGYKAALLHGNEFYRSFSAQRIVQKLTSWQTIYDFGDTYMGHFHRRDTYGMPNGTMAYMTGSPESSNAYAADMLAARGEPSQRLHFIDPDRGRVNAEHILWL